MAPLHIDISIDRKEADYEGKLKQIIQQVKPEWDMKDIHFKEYNDGLTNKLVGIWHGSFDNQVLIRIYGEKSENLINRNAEKDNIQILNKHGLAPPLYATLNNGLCYGFVPGEPFNVQSVLDEEKWIAVARTMAKFHSVNKESSNKQPVLFPLLKKFLQLIPKQFEDIKKQKRLEDDGYTIEYFKGEIELLEEKLGNCDCEVVFCHNDILLANIIWNKKDGGVQFIDYEYGGFNYLPYDIGNHFTEFAGADEINYELYPTEEYQTNWIRTYLSSLKDVEPKLVASSEIEKLRRQANKFALCSHLMWGMWGIIQSCWSSIPFDFIKFSTSRLDEYRKQKEHFLAL